MNLPEISLEAAEELRRRAKGRNVTAEVVLRELLGMPLVLPVRPPTFPVGPLTITLPDGTKVRGQRNGRTYWGTVRAGQIELHGVLYSPSGSAMIVLRPYEAANVNGWDFWRVEGRRGGGNRSVGTAHARRTLSSRPAGSVRGTGTSRGRPN